MTAIGMTLNPVLFNSQIAGPVSGAMNSYANNSVSNLIKADTLAAGNIPTGSVPAVRTGLMGKISNTGTNIASGAKSAVNSAVNSTISTTREVGNVIANDVLPKPEPLSVTLLRNRLLSAVLVGGFINGVRGMVKVAKGEINQEEALHTIFKDTAMGAIGGLSFAGGMGATASVLGRFMGGVPLSIAGLAIGTLATIGVTELVKATIPAFND